MLKTDVIKLLFKYRILLSEINKEILIDEELLEEFSDRDVYFPFAFPGLVFRYSTGRAWDTTEKKRKALVEEYRVGLSREYIGETLFVEAPPEHARGVIEEGIKKGFKRIVGVVRESVGIQLVAEPGWKEYRSISVITQCGYRIDAFRLENNMFYPTPKGPMAGIILTKKKDIDERFINFVKDVFRFGKRIGEKRPRDAPPEAFLAAFETYVETTKK